MIYGLALLSVFNFGYKFLSPDHRFYPAFHSWQNFLVFAVVFAIVAMVARAIAIWQFQWK